MKILYFHDTSMPIRSLYSSRKLLNNNFETLRLTLDKYTFAYPKCTTWKLQQSNLHIYVYARPRNVYIILYIKYEMLKRL